MQHLDMPRHRRSLGLPKSLVKHALELKLSNALVRLDIRPHLEQSVAGPGRDVARRVAAAHDDAVVGVADDLEVVRDLSADGVCRLFQVLAVPELARRLRAAVLFLEITSLVGVAWEGKISVSERGSGLVVLGGEG